MAGKPKNTEEVVSNLKITVTECSENGENENTVIYQQNTDSNVNASEIDSEVKQKLRGDAIGDTLYSESFVAKTLLQLSDLQWSEKVEEELCFLWDMTLEKDVCEYLLKLSYPNIACAVIDKYEENRLLEIVIGILANICCIADTTAISDEQIEIVLAVLNSDDALILIQVVRFIKALAYDREKLPFIKANVLEQLDFILRSSCNIELLVNSLDAMSKMTSDNKLAAELLKGELVKSSVVAYQCICNAERARLSLDEDQLETNRQRTALTHLIQIVSNICYYINIDKSDRLIQDVKRYSDAFLEELAKVFQCYSRDESLLPVSEELQFYVDALVFIFQILNVKYSSKIFRSLLNITNILLRNKCEEVDLFLELDCYFVSVGKIDELKHDLQRLTKPDTVNVLNKIKNNKTTFEFNYKENLDTLLAEFKT